MDYIAIGLIIFFSFGLWLLGFLTGLYLNKKYENIYQDHNCGWPSQ